MSLQLVYIALTALLYIGVGSYCLYTRHRRRWLCRVLQFCTGFLFTYAILLSLTSQMSIYWLILCVIDGFLNVFTLRFYLKTVQRNNTT